MKNVYITLSKKNMNKQNKNNLSPSLIKKKILQTQSNNQSCLTESAENQKYSTIYLQNKLKSITEEKFMQRLRTEIEKVSNEQND
jgi:hypothetical protein